MHCSCYSGLILSWSHFRLNVGGKAVTRLGSSCRIQSWVHFQTVHICCYSAWTKTTLQREANKVVVQSSPMEVNQILTINQYLLPLFKWFKIVHAVFMRYWGWEENFEYCLYKWAPLLGQWGIILCLSMNLRRICRTFQLIYR